MPAQERTEAATPRRRQQAREKGDVARSAEISSALVLLSAFAVFKFLGPSVYTKIQMLMVETFEGLSTEEMTISGMAATGTRVGLAFLGIVLPLAGAFLLVGVIASVGQTGFMLKSPSIELARLNPLAGLGRIFSLRSLAELPKTIIKVGILAFVLYRVLSRRLPELATLSGGDAGQSARAVADAIFDIGLQVGLVLLVLALLDYGFQRWTYERRIRMTREELKEELRQHEGSPELRGRIRRLQRQMAGRRMMNDVPKATVVITNPTTLAIALVYEAETMGAPTVVAKGARLMGERIREIATKHGVPIVENRPLAWALYRSVEVGDAIPATLYQVVAEVLAFVYSLTKRGVEPWRQ